MSLVGDDGDERQTRVDCMIDECHAQWRRLAKAATVKRDDPAMGLQSNG